MAVREACPKSALFCGDQPTIGSGALAFSLNGCSKVTPTHPKYSAMKLAQMPKLPCPFGVIG